VRTKLLSAIGQCFFGTAILVFGVQQCVYAAAGGIVFGPPWIVRAPVLTGIIGLILAIAGLSILTRFKAHIGGDLLASVLIVYVLGIFVPRLLVTPRNPGLWSGVGELLCMAGAALVAAGMDSSGALQSPAANNRANLMNAGRVLYAAPLIIFGVQHLMYARFVAMLVPAWIPARLFWACFVGIAFFAASLSIITKIQGFLAASLLGLMFFTWVLIVHVPRINLARHNANEWTSGLVALAMSGGALLMTKMEPRKRLTNVSVK
jgi:hypothetical protein